MISDPDESYQAYVEKSPVGIFVVNESGEYVDVNPAAWEMVGHTTNELFDMSIRDLSVSASEPDPVPSFEEIKRTGRMRTEATLLHKDGHDVSVLIEGVAVSDERFVAYCQDITERKEYERRLRQQRDNLDVLNQVLRHNIRNDLQLVSAYAELLADECDDEDVLDDIETVSQAAPHAVELTVLAREMADVTLPEGQDLESVSLREILDTKLKDIRATYPEAVVTSENPIPSVAVRANDMLESVFRNILKNAVQHNDSAIPKLPVSAMERTDVVVVQIADNGPEVPDEQKDAIFGRGEGGLESPGTGIGLSLVETLVEDYSGDVWVEDADSGGAVFSVELLKARHK
jgi:PAS domain S-box-containing protein